MIFKIGWRFIMKRLLGLIGAIYLSVLVIVFYFQTPLLVLALTATSTISIGLGIFFKVIKKRKKICNTLITIGLTALCAIMSIILYTNYTYQPIVDKYSYKEINISGYLCEEVQKYERTCTYTILADNINGEDENVKIHLKSYTDLEIEEFERIEATVFARPIKMNYLLSKGIFLETFIEDGFTLNKTDEKEFSLYNVAIKARKAMKQSLDILLPDTYSSLCKAVLLGDKQALSKDVKGYFTQTGTSFLIVVSGMHLSILVSVLLILLKKITKNKSIICFAVFVIVFSFMAITGFTPSVVRSGVMITLTYCAMIFLRKSDGLNSLGFSGLVLTLFNPYTVADVGMLLSFSATLGILMWSKPISNYIVIKYGIANKFLKYSVEMIATSISASLWILPITIIVFGTVSPLVLIVGFITSPIISAILILALICSVIFLCPNISFMAYLFALVEGLICKLQIWIISVFASIPHCLVNAQTPYFYIWTAVTILLVIIGYLIKEKSFYIKSAIAFSFATLIIGWTIYMIISYNTTTINIYSTNGMTVVVERGYNISLLSCGGLIEDKNEIVEDLSIKYTEIDNVIIPQKKYRYNGYLYSILCEFDVSNILVYDNISQSRYEEYDGYERHMFTDNTSFTINLNNSTTNDIINIDGITYQYVKSNNATMLLVSTGADISTLPEKYRKADYLIIDNLPENHKLLDCKEVVFCGDEKYYCDNKNSLKEISGAVQTTINSNVKLVFL